MTSVPDAFRSAPGYLDGELATTQFDRTQRAADPIGRRSFVATNCSRRGTCARRDDIGIIARPAALQLARSGIKQMFGLRVVEPDTPGGVDHQNGIGRKVKQCLAGPRRWRWRWRDVSSFRCRVSLPACNRATNGFDQSRLFAVVAQLLRRRPICTSMVRSNGPASR